MGAYLDYAATSPLLPEALEAMLPFLGEQFANPSATYAAARRSRRAIDDARDAVARLAGCEADEIVFTSGGTEADNLAVRGAGRFGPGGIVVSAVEHDAVLAPAIALGATVVPVDRDGLIDLAALEEALDRPTALVSVIAVQSETGVLTPLDAVAQCVRSVAPSALIHTDAVQAAPSLSLAEMTPEWDLVTISAHKIGGPKGAGALVVRKRARDRIGPILLGGGQERALRAGTENVAAIVGFGVAAAMPDRSARRIRALRDELGEGIVAGVPGAAVTGSGVQRVPGICHVRFPGVRAEELLILLDDANVAASAGSACASGALEPSHVLRAMGWDDEAAKEAIRFSLGRSTTKSEIEVALRATIDGVRRLLDATSP